MARQHLTGASMPLTSEATASASPVAPAPAGTSPPDDLWMIRVALVILAIIAVVAAVTYLGQILEQVLIALFLYYAITPAAQALIRRGLPAWFTYVLLLV